jgi:formate hydrogenlyase subunit 4
MGQKAIILEFAGRDLALIEWAEMIKLGFLLALSSSLFLPFLNLANWIKTGDSFVNTLEMGASFLVQMILLARLTAWWELHQPKLRLRKVAVLAWSSMLFSLATIIFVIATRS